MDTYKIVLTYVKAGTNPAVNKEGGGGGGFMCRRTKAKGLGVCPFPQGKFVFFTCLFYTCRCFCKFNIGLKMLSFGSFYISLMSGLVSYYILFLENK